MKCRWVRDASVPDGRYFVPQCWGGLNSWSLSGCYCDRAEHALDLESRLEKLEADVKKLRETAQSAVKPTESS